MRENDNGRKEGIMTKDDLIKEIMAKSGSTKYLIAKMYVEFREHFLILNGKVSFHDKFVWSFIGILITGFVGGTIALLVQFFNK